MGDLSDGELSVVRIEEDSIVKYLSRKILSKAENRQQQIRCRVAGIILQQDHILLQGDRQGGYWTIPGGGIEYLESSSDALKREMKEELGADIYIERLLWVTEEFFMAGNKARHQLAYYYLTTLLTATHLYELKRIAPVVDGGVEVIFQWFNLDELTNITLYPEFLSKALKVLPQTLEHLILIDDKTLLSFNLYGK